MKLFKLTFLLLALLSVAACGEDDEGMAVCTQADWVGTYTGSVDCDGTTEDATVTVSASGTNNIMIQYVSASSTTTYDVLPFDGCNLSTTATGGGLSVAITAMRNGNEIIITEAITSGTNTSNCNVTATKN